MLAKGQNGHNVAGTAKLDEHATGGDHTLIITAAILEKMVASADVPSEIPVANA
jgi:hypothetical protein